MAKLKRAKTEKEIQRDYRKSLGSVLRKGFNLKIKKAKK
jgi:hypothetical protein